MFGNNLHRCSQVSRLDRLRGKHNRWLRKHLWVQLGRNQKDRNERVLNSQYQFFALNQKKTGRNFLYPLRIEIRKAPQQGPRMDFGMGEMKQLFSLHAIAVHPE